MSKTPFEHSADVADIDKGTGSGIYADWAENGGFEGAGEELEGDAEGFGYGGGREGIRVGRAGDVGRWAEDVAWEDGGDAEGWLCVTQKSERRQSVLLTRQGIEKVCKRRYNSREKVRRKTIIREKK